MSMKRARDPCLQFPLTALISTFTMHSTALYLFVYLFVCLFVYSVLLMISISNSVFNNNKYADHNSCVTEKQNNQHSGTGLETRRVQLSIICYQSSTPGQHQLMRIIVKLINCGKTATVELATWHIPVQ